MIFFFLAALGQNVLCFVSFEESCHIWLYYKTYECNLDVPWILLGSNNFPIFEGSFATEMLEYLE